MRTIKLYCPTQMLIVDVGKPTDELDNFVAIMRIAVKYCGLRMKHLYGAYRGAEVFITRRKNAV